MSFRRSSLGNSRPFRGPALAIALLVACADAGSEGFRDTPAAEGSAPTPAVTAAPDAGEAIEAGDSRPTVLFLGNSLTAGLGVDPDEAFPAIVQDFIDDTNLAFRIVNAGISGETTAGGLRRIDELAERGPAVLVVALGGNDALRGVPPRTVRANLQSIVDRAVGRAPALRVVIAGMLAPPNMGDAYADEFASVFEAVAEANDAALVPFLLEGVAADPDLNQPDGIHPTPEGHRVMAGTVWEVLEPVLRAAALPVREEATDNAGDGA